MQGCRLMSELRATWMLTAGWSDRIVVQSLTTHADALDMASSKKKVAVYAQMHMPINKHMGVPALAWFRAFYWHFDWSEDSLCCCTPFTNSSSVEQKLLNVLDFPSCFLVWAFFSPHTSFASWVIFFWDEVERAVKESEQNVKGAQKKKAWRW